MVWKSSKEILDSGDLMLLLSEPGPVVLCNYDCQRTLCPSLRRYMSKYGVAMQLYWQGKQGDLGTNLCQRHFAYYKSQWTSLGREPKPKGWDTDNQPHVLWHGRFWPIRTHGLEHRSLCSLHTQMQWSVPKERLLNESALKELAPQLLLLD